MICRAVLALLLALMPAVPAAAMLPALPESEAAPTQTPAAPAIEAARDSDEDGRIARRISGIFAEVPSLSGVSVDVDEGVVTLGGMVADPAARTRAEAIAMRVTGVVTVENAIERDLSVEGGFGLSDLAAEAAGLTRMLPLAAVALAVALVIAGLGWLIASLGRLWRRITPNAFLAELVASAIRFVFAIGGVVIALDMLGAGALLGAVLGGAGVLGIALGFAMRDTIENYVASLMLSLRQPFRPNDWVQIDQHEGRVIRLTSRATILMTLDGNHLRIPNSQVFKAVILNYTTNPQRRFDFQLGIDADDDPDAGRKVGREALAALPYVLADPPPEARVAEVGDSNIVLTFLAWVDQRESDWFKARSRAIAVVKRALEEAGFALPEPIYRLRFDARTTPLPFENVGEGGVAPPAPAPSAPAPASLTVTEADLDVAAQDEIARMVEDERAGTPKTKDLLDPDRPVE